MFKRFSVADDISTQTALKSSIQRSIKKTISEQYPSIADFIDDIIPKKGDILEAKGCVTTLFFGIELRKREDRSLVSPMPGRRKDRLMFVVSDGEPLFYRVRDGPFYPTLRVLHKCKLFDVFFAVML